MGPGEADRLEDEVRNRLCIKLYGPGARFAEGQAPILAGFGHLRCLIFGKARFGHDPDKDVRLFGQISSSFSLINRLRTPRVPRASPPVAESGVAVAAGDLDQAAPDADPELLLQRRLRRFSFGLHV